ncbi:histidine kinase dimerization/phosphoacceptor domain -containing protein [Caulobacter sp. NIBR1757]|uniref:sensor histidine kinase n=1 Tax=Caulobacter sp. NIBR1757 TaxID=3016000 RepID=UPI0022F121FB|nr:histidine kinase dimerization/phosphoacceptor domain -containing protein [Caulobacter sp. NIBR1757]WGM38957.1 Blue-light-activated histidine kinase 2 [Caulobacter sp. NIBR1757]
MTDQDDPTGLLASPDLAQVLESDRFRQFLDQVPIAIAVADLRPDERICYANVEFERLTGLAAADLEDRPWSALAGTATRDGRALAEAVTAESDYLGVFAFEPAGAVGSVDVWSNLIEDESGEAVFRLIALVGADGRGEVDLTAYELRIQEKDTLLRELQHRVANNLQMVTALIRIEARNVSEADAGRPRDDRFDRLAGRIEAMGLLYRSLSGEGAGDTVDLGAFLSGIASSVMQAHAVEGIHLNLQVDSWPVSINVAMPTGLVVNELLTNALKHAFAGRDGGTITLKCLVDEDGCRVVVADDGVGLAPGVVWPRPGKLSNLIVQSLRQNAKARVEIETAPGEGMTVTAWFSREDGLG